MFVYPQDVVQAFEFSTGNIWMDFKLLIQVFPFVIWHAGFFTVSQFYNDTRTCFSSKIIIIIFPRMKRAWPGLR